MRQKARVFIVHVTRSLYRLTPPYARGKSGKATKTVKNPSGITMEADCDDDVETSIIKMEKIMPLVLLMKLRRSSRLFELC